MVDTLVRKMLSDYFNNPQNVSGIGPVRNADVYASLIDSPWLEIGAKNSLGGKGISLMSKNPKIWTPQGYISEQDLNLITMYGIPSEYTKDFVQEPFPMGEAEFATKEQRDASYRKEAGPVKDGDEYAELKRRADKTAKKEMTFEELKKKSKEIK